MDSSLILSNILNPPVLFLFIGMMAVFLKSDLALDDFKKVPVYLSISNRLWG